MVRARKGPGAKLLLLLLFTAVMATVLSMLSCTTILGDFDVVDTLDGSSAEAGDGNVGSPKDITKFTILGVDGTITGTSIGLTLPVGTDVKSLTPTIEITGVSVSPASGAAQDFTNPVTYTVLGADGSSKAYTVTVRAAGNGSKEITSFTILGVKGAIVGSSITMTLPSGTDVKSLTPTIAISGVSVAPASGVAQDFTNPVPYVVTAADGTTRAYAVTVGVASPNSKDITEFTINGVSGTIAGTSITLTLPSGTNVTSLTPAITTTGKTVAPASGVPQNFTNPVTYTVTAADNTTKVYTVTVNVAASSSKDITSFSIQGVNGAISTTSISLTMPAGTNVTSLIPTIAITGTSVSPASGVAQNFTNPVSYTVTAADNSTKVYTVSVTVAPSSAKDITSFSILGVSGTIGTNTVSVTVPSGTNVTSLTPTIGITGISVNPPSGVARDFTNPVQYTVTAADNSTKVYTATVTVAASSTKDITQFTVQGVNGTITGTNIAVTLPFGTNVTSLTPTIAITGVSVSPASGVAQNFTNPVTYVVTAADNSTKSYTATVTVSPPPSITCVDQGLLNTPFNFLCSANPPAMTPGGTFVNGGYRLSRFWRNGGCGAEEKYHLGSATIFSQNGNTFMRWMILYRAVASDPGTTIRGTYWLQSNGTGGLTRTELCRAGFINTQETGTYQQTANQLIMNFGGAYAETWEIPP